VHAPFLPLLPWNSRIHKQSLNISIESINLLPHRIRDRTNRLYCSPARILLPFSGAGSECLAIPQSTDTPCRTLPKVRARSQSRRRVRARSRARTTLQPAGSTSTLTNIRIIMATPTAMVRVISFQAICKSVQLSLHCYPHWHSVCYSKARTLD
jgi:hypothetical protein